METEELIRIAKANGCKVDKCLGILVITKDAEDASYHIEVDTERANSVFIDVDKYPNESFSTIIASIEYARTPVEEREEEKKYYLEHRWLNRKGTTGAFLNYTEFDNDYYTDSDEEVGGCQTQFTKKEIDEIKEKFNTDLKDFEIIEVEE